MQPTAVLIDFGSTYTKVTAVDLESARILGRAEAPTTVENGVHEGLCEALRLLAATASALACGRTGLDLLDGLYVRASSSAAGGLRIVVVGNVPGLTAEAGTAAALGAGAKVVGTFGFKLSQDGLHELQRMRPDLVLLTGGTEGGDSGTILHNACQLAGSRLAMPFVVAGNSGVRDETCRILARSGKHVSHADNVMPGAGQLSPEPAREEIRRKFIARITAAKGFERLAPLVPIVQATPDAVLRAAVLAAHGTKGLPGWGDLVLVDIGGATTDVHSIGDGTATGIDIVPRGLAEPYEKRTVEGDLGIRVNAETIVARAGADQFCARYRSLFADLPVARDELLAYAHAISVATERTPRQDWELAADATLGQLAADIAIARHVGRREPYYARDGVVWLQSGKNLTEAKVLVGTGGIFAHNRFARRILQGGGDGGGQPRILRPQHPRLLCDEHYIMHVAGLLAEDHPRVARRLLEQHLIEGGTVRVHGASAVTGHAHSHDDCC